MSPPVIRLMFEHPRCYVAVIIDVPPSITESASALANRVRPICPRCAKPLHRRRIPARTHAPVINNLRLIGCTCGWQVPPNTADPDDALVAHVAANVVTKDPR